MENKIVRCWYCLGDGCVCDDMTSLDYTCPVCQGEGEILFSELPEEYKIKVEKLI